MVQHAELREDEARNELSGLLRVHKAIHLELGD